MSNNGAMSKIFGALGFGNNNAQAPQAPQAQINQNQQAVPGNIPQQNSMPASNTNPTVPASSVESMNTPAEKKPQGLDQYKELWTAPKENKGPKPRRCPIYWAAASR